MNFKPLFNRVAVKPDQAKEKSSGGIYIPDNAKESPSTGTVVSIGTSVADLMKVGDCVLYLKGTGYPVNINGEDCLVLRCDEDHSEILAVIEP